MLFAGTRRLSLILSNWQHKLYFLPSGELVDIDVWICIVNYIVNYLKPSQAKKDHHLYLYYYTYREQV